MASVLANGWRALAWSIVVAPGAACAQQVVEPLLGTTVLPDFGRDRNESVAQMPRPDYDPVGVNVGLFQIFADAAATTLANSNVFYNDFNKHSDLVETIQPTVYARSDWDKDYFSVFGVYQVKEYLRNRLLDKNLWSVQSNGEIDIGDQYSIKAFIRTGQFVENPISSALQPNLAALSEFHQAQESLQGAWLGGPVRLTLEAIHTGYFYLPLVYTTGARIDQGGRDNTTSKELIQVEYALSPVFAAYSQVAVDQTRYPFDGVLSQPKRNSNGFKIVGGVSLDLAGVARGALGVGYLRCNYADAIFESPAGFSLEGKVELFPSRLTTLTLLATHSIMDTTVGPSVAYYDTHVEVTVDHEVSHNTIISGKIFYGNQEFLDSSLRRNFLQSNLGAKLLVNRRIALNFKLEFTKSVVNEFTAGAPFNQFIGSVAVQYKI